MDFLEKVITFFRIMLFCCFCAQIIRIVIRNNIFQNEHCLPRYYRENEKKTIIYV